MRNDKFCSAVLCVAPFSFLIFHKLEEILTSAGFDLWTLWRTTPEELNACGVTNPKNRHVMRIELSRLQLPDVTPDTLPVGDRRWFFLYQRTSVSEVRSNFNGDWVNKASKKADLRLEKYKQKNIFVSL